MECTEFETFSGRNARQGGHRQTIWKHFVANCAFVARRSPSHGCRSALFRVLWLRHHHRQYAETVAGRSECVAIVDINHGERSHPKVQTDRQHYIDCVAAERSAGRTLE